MEGRAGAAPSPWWACDSEAVTSAMTSFPGRRGGCRPCAGLRLLAFLLYLCLVLGTLSWSCSCFPHIFHFAAFLSSFYSLLMFNLFLPFTLTSPSLSLCLLLLSFSSSFLSSSFLCFTLLFAHLLCSFGFLFLFLPFPLLFLFLLCQKCIWKLVLLPSPHSKLPSMLLLSSPS